MSSVHSLSVLLLIEVKEADNSFQHFSNSYTLKDKYCHCLSDATIMVSYKYKSLVNKLRLFKFCGKFCGVGSVPKI